MAKNDSFSNNFLLWKFKKNSASTEKNRLGFKIKLNLNIFVVRGGGLVRLYSREVSALFAKSEKKTTVCINSTKQFQGLFQPSFW
jgi:hypothetical protein